MISMYTKQEIIIKRYREGKSHRCISRELGLNCKTVSKYISEYESTIQDSTSFEAGHSKYVSTAPAYKAGNREKQKLTQEVQDVIDSLLFLNDKKKQQGLHKKLLKKKDILEELHRQGIDIGYTTVCNYVSTKQSRVTINEAYIRQVYNPEESCEFDWGEVKLYINSKLTRFQLAVFTSSYSNFCYVLLYNQQDTLSFTKSHVYFFETIGGVFKIMVYDNMRVAVSM